MAKTSANIINLPGARREPPARLTNREELREAIGLAQQNLLRQQKPDGHWVGELMVDSTLCSDYVLFMHWVGDVDETLQRRYARHILQRQLPDGGWNIYYGGPSEINASVKAYFALKLAGHSPDTPFMQEARANILRLGGIPRMNTYSKLYLALLGQFPWKYLLSFQWKWFCSLTGVSSIFTRCRPGAGPCSSRWRSLITSSRRGIYLTTSNCTSFTRSGRRK